MNVFHRQLDKTDIPSTAPQNSHILFRKRFEAEGGRLALIPVDGEEVLAYEYLCTYGEDEYVIYLNAQTGEEEEVFIVRNGLQGRYLR